MVGLNYEYARKIVKRYNEQRMEGVKNQKKISKPHRRRKKTLLNEEQLQLLAQKLKERPDDGRIWTGQKVARWIEKKTQKEKIGNQRGWEYLKKHSTS